MSPKVKGSLPDGVFENFRLRNPSARTVASRSTQAVQKWVPEIFAEGKRGQSLGLTSPTFMCRFSENPGSLNLLEPSGPIYTCTAMTLPVKYLNYVATCFDS